MTVKHQRLLVLNDPHSMRVSKDLANEIGLNESLLLLQLEFLISITDHVHEGKRWTYQSGNDLKVGYFPFWSLPTIARTIRRLHELELITIGNFNLDRRDRTQWFALDPVGIARLRSVAFRSYADDECISQNEKCIVQDDECIGQNDSTIPETSSREEIGDVSVETSREEPDGSTARPTPRGLNDLTTTTFQPDDTLIAVERSAKTLTGTLETNLPDAMLDALDGPIVFKDADGNAFEPTPEQEEDAEIFVDAVRGALTEMGAFVGGPATTREPAPSAPTIAPSAPVPRPPGTPLTKHDRIEIGDLIASYSTMLGDDPTSRAASATQACNLFAKSTLTLPAFVATMQLAFQRTQQYSASIRKEGPPSTVSAYPQKNKMPYFFTILTERVAEAADVPKGEP